MTGLDNNAAFPSHFVGKSHRGPRPTGITHRAKNEEMAPRLFCLNAENQWGGVWGLLQQNLPTAEVVNFIYFTFSHTKVLILILPSV